MINRVIPAGRTVTCVVVDDDPDWIEHVRRLLTAAHRSSTVVPFVDAGKALEYLRKGTADIVITALHMPGIDGCAFTEEFREFNHQTPVIVMTCDVDARDDVIGCGADEFIPKYALRAELLEAVIRQVATGEALAES
jgi:DNA-binding NarL/FixJ family response regulator